MRNDNVTAHRAAAVDGFSKRHSIIFDRPRERLPRTDERMSRIHFGTPRAGQDRELSEARFGFDWERPAKAAAG